MKITTVGIDIAKSVFHGVAVNKMGALVKKKQLKRNELLTFIAQLEPCRIALEACGGAHHSATAPALLYLRHPCRRGRASFGRWGTR